jgi:hypothetical protein
MASVVGNGPAKPVMQVSNPLCLLSTNYVGLGNPERRGETIFSKRSVKTKLRCLSPRDNYTDLSDRRLSAKLVSTFADRGCRVVSGTDPHGRILGLLDRSRYFFFQVAPHLYSRG